MAQQIARFGVGQTAKVFGVLYALVGLVFLPVFAAAAAFSPRDAGFGMGFALVLPILYGVGGWIGCAIGCVAYNMVAQRIGGIEIEMSAGSR